MIPAAFDYAAPTTVDEAVQALASAGDREVKVLGGGQSLLPALRLRLASPDLVVDLGRVSELKGITEDGDALVIGAMTTHAEVKKSALVQQHAALLSLAAGTVADEQVRHRGTLGGSLVHADPAGDLGAPVLALGASFEIAGPGGRRTVSAADFFLDVFTTAVGEGEILVSVRIPKHTGWGAQYEKFNRTAQAWSIVAVAATVRAEGGSIAQARVALTNMGLVPVRAAAVEQALVGQPASADAIAAAAQHAAEGTSPMADSNADEDYRRHLAKVLTGRALATAAGV